MIPTRILALAGAVAGVVAAAPHEERFDEFHPIWWSQYTVADGGLKLQVQLEPGAELDVVKLEIQSGEEWLALPASRTDELSSTVLFRDDGWEEERAVRYRVSHPEADRAWTGSIRPEPGRGEEFTLVAVSCLNSKDFPYAEAVARMRRQDPDLVFFAGDQIYEGNGGFPIVEARSEEELPAAAENYLLKWWYFGRTFRELLKDRPSVMIPDDHDVYSNDLWGEGGKRMEGSRTSGGYAMHPKWVDAVERTQMGHLPDPIEPDSLPSGIRPRYTRLEWGAVDCVILEDRKFKSAPERVLEEPIGTKSLEVVRSRDFDPAVLDAHGLQLLGERQERFLAAWAEDRDGRMKVVLSQSPFVNVATYHPLDADLDSNGWPQSARTRALRSIERAGAVMVQGDVHLATLHRHILPGSGAGPWAMSLPGLHPPSRRSWERELGESRDNFGNRFALRVVSNGVDGYGLLRFRPRRGEVVFECWPTEGEAMVAGWPVVVEP